MFQPTLLDDAGQRVPLVRFQVTLLPISAGPLPLDVQRAIRRMMKRENWRLEISLSRQAIMRGAWLGVLPFALMFGSFFVLMHFRLLQRLAPFGGVLLILVMMPVISLVMAAFMPFSLTDHVRKLCAHTAVDAGYCGSCGYGLKELPDSASGLCRCSECGAAWARRKGEVEVPTLPPSGQNGAC